MPAILAWVEVVYDRRPWGTFTVLDEGDGYKVKRLSVDPRQRLSYQVHAHRAEHWTIVAGTALVTLDSIPFTLHPGDTISIPVGGAHRVENLGDDEMVFVEVQTGEYFGEDDIVRLDDDYGRSASDDDQPR
jgi:mannose-6-phosphate isomerase-like protein (cupin superfamily)